MARVTTLGKTTQGKASTCEFGFACQTSGARVLASSEARSLNPETIDYSTLEESRKITSDAECRREVDFENVGQEHNVTSVVYDLYGGGKRKKADSDSDYSPSKSRKKRVKQKNAKRRKGHNQTDREKTKV